MGICSVTTGNILDFSPYDFDLGLDETDSRFPEVPGA